MSPLPQSLHGGWRKLTLLRLKSELKTLRFARRLWPISIFPIFAKVMAWWFLAALPILLVVAALGFVGINVFDPPKSNDAKATVLGFVAWFALAAYAFAITVFGAPWVFRWYFIAVGLSCGRSEMADRKEAELIAAIATADQSG